MSAASLRSLEPFIAWFKPLQPDAQPLWGAMDAHQVLDHLTLVVQASCNQVQAPQLVPADKLERARAFLFQTDQFKRGFDNPALKQVPQHQSPDFQAAWAALRRQAQAFDAYFAENPDARPVHPQFGPLSYSEWVLFHEKHFRHHARQFGLLPIPEGQDS